MLYFWKLFVAPRLRANQMGYRTPTGLAFITLPTLFYFQISESGALNSSNALESNKKAVAATVSEYPGPAPWDLVSTGPSSGPDHTPSSVASKRKITFI
ncbi:hypothetical protein RRG08_066928 [Elysia crispata]|uniref:Uncharacterized protein n=1 Tax=Elysia crispata TaxID=231223 RepID=A0AAE1AR72_9GAST|nr:hypothetical protein RRG08_066928 [Elysia crispata]